MATAIQMAKIAIDTDFLKRVEYFMSRKALAVAAGTPDTNDQALIQKVLDGQESVRSWSIAAVTNATIASGTHAGDGSTIPDNDLEFQINTQWTAFKV
jgi:hypothetical protein